MQCVLTSSGAVPTVSEVVKESLIDRALGAVHAKSSGSSLQFAALHLVTLNFSIFRMPRALRRSALMLLEDLLYLRLLKVVKI